MVWWFKSIRDLATWMKRIENDVFIFITYHKEESQDEKTMSMENRIMQMPLKIT